MPAARASELSVGICSCNFGHARRVIVAPPYGRAPALGIKRRELGRFVQVVCPPSFVKCLPLLVGRWSGPSPHIGHCTKTMESDHFKFRCAPTRIRRKRKVTNALKRVGSELNLAWPPRKSEPPEESVFELVEGARISVERQRLSCVTSGGTKRFGSVISHPQRSNTEALCPLLLKSGRRWGSPLALVCLPSRFHYALRGLLTWIPHRLEIQWMRNSSTCAGQPEGVLTLKQILDFKQL